MAPGSGAPRRLTVGGTDEPPRAEALPAITPNFVQEALAYQRDLFERTILFWDTLHQRADNMIAHERAGKPPHSMHNQLPLHHDFSHREIQVMTAILRFIAKLKRSEAHEENS